MSASRDIAIQRLLLAQMERARDGVSDPVLHLGWISAPAVVLGRYQRRQSALGPAGSDSASLRVVRRVTGGRAVWTEPGQLSVSLVMSEMSSLLPPGSAAIGSGKIINRYVRGILGGLQSLGFKAYYFGRDFLSVERKLAGYVSFEVAPSGATLFHVLIGVSRATALPSELDGYPGVGGNRPDPPPTTLAAESSAAPDRATLERAIVDGYSRNQHIEVRERKLSPLEERLLDEREASTVVESEPPSQGAAHAWLASELKPIACGWLEAAVQVVQDQFLGAVRLSGDFMAPSGSIEALERELRLVPLEWREIGAVVDRMFGEGEAAIAGVRYLRVIPDAILDAASRRPGGGHASLSPTD